MKIIKTLTIRLDDELHKKFKSYAAIEGKDMRSIIIDFIEDLIDKKIQAEKQKQPVE